MEKPIYDSEVALLVESHVKEHYEKLLSEKHPDKRFMIFDVHKYCMFDCAIVEGNQLLGFAEIKVRDKNYPTAMVKYGKYLMATVLFNMLKLKCYLLTYIATTGEIYMSDMTNLHHKGQFKTTGSEQQEDYAYYEVKLTDITGKIPVYEGVK